MSEITPDELTPLFQNEVLSRLNGSIPYNREGMARVVAVAKEVANEWNVTPAINFDVNVDDETMHLTISIRERDL